MELNLVCNLAKCKITCHMQFFYRNYELTMVINIIFIGWLIF